MYPNADFSYRHFFYVHFTYSWTFSIVYVIIIIIGVSDCRTVRGLTRLPTPTRLETDVFFFAPFSFPSCYVTGRNFRVRRKRRAKIFRTISGYVPTTVSTATRGSRSPPFAPVVQTPDFDVCFFVFADFSSRRRPDQRVAEQNHRGRSRPHVFLHTGPNTRRHVQDGHHGDGQQKHCGQIALLQDNGAYIYIYINRLELLYLLYSAALSCVAAPGQINICRPLKKISI